MLNLLSISHISNLFSVFDPAGLGGVAINWVSCFVGLMLMPPVMWASSSFRHSFRLMTQSIHGELAALMSKWTPQTLTLLPLCLCVFILLNNSLGLFPYIFTASSHLSFTVTLALPLWLGHMMFSWYNSPQRAFAHLVPLGTPGPLMAFMVMIELISSVIRPLTLAVRLAANMIAGHLLLTLLSSLAPHATPPVLMLILMALILLGMLEMGVALIQAYVFSVLSSLYFSEVNNKQFY